MASNRVISADSHAMEPADLWTTRLDANLRDKAPRVVETSKGHLFSAPGVRPFPVAGGFGIGKSGDDLKEHLKKGYEAARPSGWDPAERIKDQDIDGVQAEAIYTTLGMPLFGLDDAELERCAKLGLKGAMIWGVPPEDKPYYSELYDPFWAAAQEMKMPLSLHVITQRDQKGRRRDKDGERTGENQQ